MTKLRSFDFAATRNRNSWDWTQLTDGGTYKLVKGTDYTAKYAAAQVRVYAKAHNLKVKISGGNPSDDKMIIQFDTDKPKAKKNRKADKVAAQTPEATAAASN